MSRKSRRNRRREAEKIRNQPPDLAPQEPDVQGDAAHQELVARRPELQAALQDNTAMLMGMRDRAEASLDTSFGIDADAQIMQERLREAMRVEKDPERKLRLEAAYLEACKRRAQGAQGIGLANVLHRSIPLTPMAKEGQGDGGPPEDAALDQPEEARDTGEGEDQVPELRGEGAVPGQG